MRLAKLFPIVFAVLAIMPSLAWSSEEGEANPWANSPYHEWMSKQLVNPEAMTDVPFVPWASCCDHTDRVQTQFRVGKGAHGDDEWWFLDPKDNTWKIIPRSVIHEEADPTMPLQLRTEGVLFIYFGIPTCFWPPEGGI